MTQSSRSVETIINSLSSRFPRSKSDAMGFAEELKTKLREELSETSSQLLRDILKLSSVKYSVVVTEQGRGCWEGSSTSHRDERDLDLRKVRQIARQELLRRGEPETQTGDSVPRYKEKDLKAALRYWNRKILFRKGTRQIDLLKKVTEMPGEKAVLLLAGAMQSQDVTLRKTALRMAASLTPIPVQIVSIAAQDEDSGILFETIEILKETRGKEAADLLGEVITRWNPGLIRTNAIKALGTVRNPASAAILINLYGSATDVPFKKLIIETAGAIGSPAVINMLSEILSDPDEEIMTTALDALRPYGEIVVLDSIIASLKMCRGDTAVRNLNMIANGNDHSRVDAVQPFLSDPNPEIRLAAVGALSSVTSERVLQLLKKALSDPSKPVVKRAIDLIAWFHGKTGTVLLKQLVVHDDLEIARNAMVNLCMLRVRGIESTLVEALEHSDEVICFFAAAELARRLRPEGFQALEFILRSGSIPIGERAVAALHAHKDIEGLQVLCSNIQKTSGTVQKAILKVFSKVLFLDAVPGLISVLTSASGDILIAAAEALKFQKWQPENPEQAKLFYIATKNLEGMVTLKLPEAVDPLREKVFRTSVGLELRGYCKNLAEIDHPSAVKVLIDVLNCFKGDKDFYPASCLIEIDNSQAHKGLVDYIFNPKAWRPVEYKIMDKAGGGIIQRILNRTRDPKTAEKAVKFLSSIMQERPSIASEYDLAAIASLSTQAIVIKTTEVACRVVLVPTSRIRQLDCSALRQLAKQEQSRRTLNG